MRTLTATLVLVAVLGACGADDSSTNDQAAADATAADATAPGTDAAPPPTAPPASTAPVPSAPDPSTSSTPSDSAPSAQAADVAADLAEREGVDPADVAIVSAENVTWRDTSLGCPKKDMGYLQVLTDGVRIVLEIDGEQFSYHGAADVEPFYCATPQEPLENG